jgi:gamma-glutamyltranspeptidase
LPTPCGLPLRLNEQHFSSVDPPFAQIHAEPAAAIFRVKARQTVLAIVRHVEFGLAPADALGRPRFHQQWRPDKLRIERAVPEDVQAELQKRGHTLDVVTHIGVSQAVARKDGEFSGANDPRVDGKAEGF